VTASDAPLKQTPLDALHRARGAKMVAFAGYDMPVQYPAGIMAEHKHTRTAAGLFDVSHMGQARLYGENAVDVIEALVPGDYQGLAEGQTRYTVFTNDQGGIQDDLMITRCADHFYIVVNAACKDQDFAHIAAHITGDARFEIIEDHALIALQGPKAEDVLARFAPPVRHMLFMTAEALHVADAPCFITRSGYTGEDGYELSVPMNQAERIADLLLAEDEVEPVGLGARDSLRLEAGLCLYGSDIDTTTTPVEADLKWVISKRRRETGGFPGADIILGQLRDGAPRKRVGIKPEGKAPARAHTDITDENGTKIGEITSGGFGPTVGGPVAMGYVATEFAEPGRAVTLMVRGKPLPATVAALPFVKQNYKK